ncbi:encapsulin, partial [Kitasatospora sp. NPDC059571]|uniref:encapsulin n=1 Tax=Kitasatospora sp. NPDC059571 TaxID=3346871 RepID=UPI003691A3D3
MNNLHRELAPITSAAWSEIEEEARRTFERHVAGRRAVDVTGPDGPGLAAVGTGHLAAVEAPAPGVGGPGGRGPPPGGSGGGGDGGPGARGGRA